MDINWAYFPFFRYLAARYQYRDNNHNFSCGFFNPTDTKQRFKSVTPETECVNRFFKGPSNRLVDVEDLTEDELEIFYNIIRDSLA